MIKRIVTQRSYGYRSIKTEKPPVPDRNHSVRYHFLSNVYAKLAKSNEAISRKQQKSPYFETKSEIFRDIF